MSLGVKGIKGNYHGTHNCSKWVFLVTKMIQHWPKECKTIAWDGSDTNQRTFTSQHYLNPSCRKSQLENTSEFLEALNSTWCICCTKWPLFTYFMTNKFTTYCLDPKAELCTGLWKNLETGSKYKKYLSVWQNTQYSTAYTAHLYQGLALVWSNTKTKHTTGKSKPKLVSGPIVKVCMHTPKNCEVPPFGKFQFL